MKALVFSVFDNAVKAFMPPFVSPTKGSAIRSFTDAVRVEGSQFALHSGDFTLFLLASFDDASGVFESLSVPERIMTALEVDPGGMPSKAFGA